jgi:ATP-dependent DNA helicase RecQ
MSTRKNYDKILKEYYGYDGLKDLQFEIIDNIIKKQDVIALLPTSYGKSICYQMPYLITNKNVLVVSPLISLMQDQMNDLIERNIDVICLNSNNKRKNSDIKSIYDGNAKIIYVTPEFLVSNQDFLENLSNNDALALIAIDECHCISSWGHSFRSDYQKLSFLKRLVPDVPLLGLTASATEKVLLDIKKILEMDDPKIIKHSVDRKNLYIEINQKDENTFDDKIVPLLKKFENEKVIVYCKTVNDTEKIAEKIKKLKYKCEAYHAKKSDSDRSEIQSQFTSGEINIISSTIAFGMGINISNIRLLIHYNCANDIEAYIQEIGRAGRDGNKSYCYMFYSSQDFILNYGFLKDIKNDVIRKQKEKDIDYLKKFISTNECRRVVLLKYFDEDVVENCNNCDNCINSRYQRNFGKEAYLLFGLMNAISGTLGISTYIKLLLGSKDKIVSKWIDQCNIFHGKGKEYSDKWWKKFISLLTTEQYISETKIKTGSYMGCAIVIKLTQKALRWLATTKSSNEKTLMIDTPINFKCDDKNNEQIKLDKQNEALDELQKAFPDKIKKPVIKRTPIKKIITVESSESSSDDNQPKCAFTNIKKKNNSDELTWNDINDDSD